MEIKQEQADPIFVEDGLLFRININGIVEVLTPEGRSFVSRPGGASRTQRERAEQIARDWCLHNSDRLRELLAKAPKRSWWRRLFDLV